MQETFRDSPVVHQRVIAFIVSFGIVPGVLQSRDVEIRLRRMDEERARLSSDLATAQAGRSQVEVELSGVVKQWEEDGKRWALERKRLTDKIESLLGGGSQYGACGDGDGA